MKRSSEDKARLRTLLSNAISFLCKNSLGLIDLQFSVEALIGISVGNEDVMVVSFKETILPDGGAVSYIWQKDTEECKAGEAAEDDLQAIVDDASYHLEHLRGDNFVCEPQDTFDDMNASCLQVKVEKDCSQYDEYQGNFSTGDVQETNSSSPRVTNQMCSHRVTKRRKQYVPIRVCNDQSDHNEVDRPESRKIFNKRLVVHHDYSTSAGFNASAGDQGQFYDSTANGDSLYSLENTKHPVPSKQQQTAYKSANPLKISKRTSGGSYTSISGKRPPECSNDLSPSHLSINDQDAYSSQAENYTYQVLTSFVPGSANGKRRKHVASSTAKNFSEQDSIIISELLPYLHDQHRPMLIPPTVTQFAPKKRCRVCYSKKIRKEVRYCCYGCSDHPGLCLEPCFYQFHLVRGSAHPKPTDSIGYSQEVPTENDCLQTMELCPTFNETGAETT